LPHGLTLPNPECPVGLEVKIEKIQQCMISLELMKLVDAKSVHVVIYLDDLFAFSAPIPLDLFP
jgi:hypothetical protein